MFSRALTYGDFRRTGVQDCGNVMSIDEFDFKGGGTAEQIVARTWAGWEEDGMEEQWLEQQDDLEGLDPHQCYEAWRDGWKACATRVVGYELIDRAKRADDDEEWERERGRDNPPAGWWKKPAPTLDRPCYRTKSEALKKFLDTNYEIVENYGGADYEVSPSEFDAINHKYDLTGKKAARTIAQAVWASMPVGKPYCLDRIDIDALNDTSPAREAGLAFRLPDVVHETAMAEAEARHYGAPPADEPEPSWVTERETPRSPALPPMPIRLQLEEREPGVETYQMFSNPSSAKRWMVWFAESPNSYVQVTAGGYMEAMRLAASKFKGAHDGETREMIAKIDGGRAIESLVTIHHGGRLTFHPSPPRGNPSDDTIEGVGESAPFVGEISVGDTFDATTTTGEKQFTVERYYDESSGVRRWYVIWSDGRRSSMPSSAFSAYNARLSTPRGNPGKTYRVEQQDQYGTWKVTDHGVTKSYADKTAEWVRGKGGKARVSVDPKDNPAWVTNIISKHYVKLEDEVPAKWLPKITKTTASRGKISATMKEYGCGAYGCVLPTLDPKVVLKLTTDETEAQFAHEMADKLTAPVVVKYHLVRALPEKYKGRPSFLLWRDSATDVGQAEQRIAEDGGTDPTVVEEAIAAQHKAAQDAFDALHEGRDARKLIQKWEDAAREMGLMVPELKELAEGMITNLHKDKVFFGDVHAGNIGLVNGHWVVVDPGHVAVLEGS